MEALFGHITRMLRAKLDPIHEIMSRLEFRATSGSNSRFIPMRKGQDEDVFDVKYEYESQNENREIDTHDQRFGTGKNEAPCGRYKEGGQEMVTWVILK